MFKTTILLTAVTLFASTGVASAQTLIIDEAVEDRVPTDVSGSGGTETRVGFNEALAWGVEWSEDHDAVCWLRLNGVKMSKGEKQDVSRAYDRCEQRNSSTKRVKFGAVNDDTYRGIRGIRVCTNNKGTDLKGIKLWPVRVDLETGAVSDDGSSAKTVKRTNCKKWHTARFCPAGKVATGFILQLNEYKQVQGVALECSSVRVSQPMERPKQ